MMYSASTGSVGSSGSTLVGVAAAAAPRHTGGGGGGTTGPPPANNNNNNNNNNNVIFDPTTGAILDPQGICFCYRFLNPYSSPIG